LTEHKKGDRKETRMSKVIDPGERLRAANPVSSYAIDDEHLDDMVTAIVGAPQVSPRATRLHSWQARAASIAAVVALLASGVAVALSAGGGSQLRALALKSVQVSSSGNASEKTIHGFDGGHRSNSGPIPPETFVPGPNLSNASSSAPVYDFTPISDPTSELALVASTLNVANSVVQPGGDNGCGTTLRGDTSSVFTSCSVPLDWSFNIKLPTCQNVTTNAAGKLVPCVQAEGFLDSGATQSQLSQWSSSDATTLAPSGLTIGAPDYAFNLNWVSYPCELNGVEILGCSESFQFSNAGELLYATGPLDPSGTFTSIGDYPLLSPLEGVSEVASGGTSHGPPPTSTTTVTLTSSTTEYALATLVDGDHALVPAFVFTGSAGGSYSAIAIDPADLSGGGSS
jgi:hypothetical protein